MKTNWDTKFMEDEPNTQADVDYYNFLVNNGMTKHSAEQAVDYLEHKRAQARADERQKVIDEVIEIIWQMNAQGKDFDERARFAKEIRKIKTQTKK